MEVILPRNTCRSLSGPKGCPYDSKQEGDLNASPGLRPGDTAKLREHPKDLNTKRRRKRRRGRANSPGYGNSLRYESLRDEMGNPQPSPKARRAMDAVHRPNGSGWF